ncbi:MAG: adenylate kinase [Actinomycetota bacterium]|nr:adenylate kinase [Actinomycetota bacterium]
MRLLMVAPPGAGKGTQAKRLADHYDIEHISSGDLFRQEVAAGTEIGRQAKRYLEAGDLVPDEFVLNLVASRVAAAAAAGGYILDGYPRNVHQAEAARELAANYENIGFQSVIHLRVSRDELRGRMVARSKLEARTDDTAATIEHRLEVFDSQTEPLLEYYANRGLLLSVDGELTVAAVTATIIAHLDAMHASADA